MTMDPETRSGRSPRHRSAIEAFEHTASVVELLARHRLDVAPHVAARLGLALAGDADAIIEVAETLRPGQRLGHEVLPDPLPLVPAVDAAVGLDGDGRVAEWERRVLLAASVCLDDRIDVLLAVAGHGMAELIRGAVSRHLLLVAGHFAFVDPRVRVAVHGRASLAERTEVHAALAAAYDAFGDERHALWHRSLATLEGDRRLAAPLIAFARAADASGDTELAHSAAREAASHAVGEEVDEAKLVAGAAALRGGQVADATAWFADVLGSGEPEQRARALVGELHARTLLTGDVPDAELDTRLAELEPLAGAGARSVVADCLVSAVALAACLHAERGAAASARRRLDQATRLGRRFGGQEALLRTARRWCAVFDVGPASADAPASPPAAAASTTPWGAMGVLAEAIGAGVAGDAEVGLRALTTMRELRGDGEGGQLAASPLERAAAAVVAALLELWQGEVERATRRLRQAAADLPVVLPLAGLGAAVLRRAETIAEGRRGAFSRALEAAGGAGCPRSAEVVDRAIAAYLAGREVEASTLAALAADHAPRGREVLRLPGLDEAEPPSPGPTEATASGAPPDTRLAETVRRQVRAAETGEQFERSYLAAIGLARSIASPYERARTELVLADGLIAFGRPGAARRHLVAADSLFRQAGAPAWRRLVAERLAGCADAVDASDEATAPTRPIVIAPSPFPTAPTDEARAQGGAGAASAAPDDPLAVCRAAWAPTLTERELEVAMLVVDGASNRDAANRLFVSVRTVEVHVGRVFTKLGVHSRVELAVLAHRMSHAALTSR